MTAASPLGRYEGGPDEDLDLHEVRLLNLPVRVYIAGRERHDELMREFALLALGGPSGRTDLPKRLLELTEILGVRFGSASERPDDVVDGAVGRGDDTVDLTYRVPAQVVEAADVLEGLMAEADEFCRTEQLLTLARDPVIVEFSAWYLAEFRRQVAGRPPRPWSGPLDPDS